MRRRQDLRRSAVLPCQGQGRTTVYREIEREHTAAGAADGYYAIAEREPEDRAAALSRAGNKPI